MRTKRRKPLMLLATSLSLLALALPGRAWAQDADDPPARSEQADGTLASGQRQVGQRFREL